MRTHAMGARRQLLLTVWLLGACDQFLPPSLDKDDPDSAAYVPTTPTGRVPKAGDTAACRAGLRAAVEAIKKDGGYGYEVEDADVDGLLSSGALTKKYARDGVRYELTFGLQTAATACTLKMYKFAVTKPGSRSITFPPDQAMVDSCACEG